MAHTVTASMPSTGSPERLWQLVSDLEHWPRHLDTFVEVTPLQPGPPRLGARYRVRQPALAAAVYTITWWQDGEGFSWRTGSRSLTGTAEHRITPDGLGHRLDLAYTWSGPVALVVHRALRRKVQELLDHEAETFTWLAGVPA